MWRVFMIVGTFFFGLGSACGFGAAGFSLVDGEWRQALGIALGATVLGFVARACRHDWRLENQKREAEAERPES